MALSADQLAASIGLGGARPLPSEHAKADADSPIQKMVPNKDSRTAKHDHAPSTSGAERVAEGLVFPTKAVAKSKRLNFAVYQDEAKRWTKAAKMMGVSLTVLIETVMNDFCDRNKIG